MKLFNMSLEQMLGRALAPAELGYVHEVIESELDGEDESDDSLWSTQHLNKPIEICAAADKPDGITVLQQVLQEVNDLRTLAKALVSLSRDPSLYKGWDLQLEARDEVLLPAQDPVQVGGCGV